MGKVGTRFMMFSKNVGAALRSYIGKRREGYVFVERKPLQSFRPMPGWGPGARRCRWKKYDKRGKAVGIGNCYLRAGRGMSSQQAWAHFAELAARDRAQRPLGARPCVALRFRRPFRRTLF